jgi:hypothetical protein
MPTWVKNKEKQIDSSYLGVWCIKLSSKSWFYPHMSEDHLKLVGVPGTGWSTRKTCSFMRMRMHRCSQSIDLSRSMTDERVRSAKWRSRRSWDYPMAGGQEMGKVTTWAHFVCLQLLTDECFEADTYFVWSSYRKFQKKIQLKQVTWQDWSKLSPRVEDEKLDSQTYEDVSSNVSVYTLDTREQLIWLPKPNQNRKTEGWLAGNIPMKVGYHSQERVE